MPIRSWRRSSSNFTNEAAYVPPEIMLPEQIDEAKVIEEWLNRQRGETGSAHSAAQRAEQGTGAQWRRRMRGVTLTSLKAQWLADENKQMNAVTELQQVTGNAKCRRCEWNVTIFPTRKGRTRLASMVVFERGAAKKSDYRKFKIKTVEGANDFASLQEVLRASRFKRASDADGRGRSTD